MNYVPYSTIDNYYKIKGETHETNNSVENFETNAIDQAELQQFISWDTTNHRNYVYPCSINDIFDKGNIHGIS